MILWIIKAIAELGAIGLFIASIALWAIIIMGIIQ